MNLWEFEGGIVCNHFPLYVSFLREQLVGGPQKQHL